MPVRQLTWYRGLPRGGKISPLGKVVLPLTRKGHLRGGNRARESVAPLAQSQDRQRIRVLISAAVVALVTCVAYVNTLHNPFFFDDDLTILKNPTIQSLFPLSVVLSPPAGGSPVQSRPFVNLSFALNHAIGGTNTFGYHLVNLGIHLLAALTLMGIVRRTLAETEPCRPLAGSAVGLSCAIATIWAVHPLDTEAITYVTQRTESLAGFLYLATLYGVIRGAHSERPVPWYVLAVAASALGMASKETMVTAPVVVMAFDAVFLSGSVRKAWRQRKSLYVSLALTWLVLVYDLASNGLARSTGAGFGGEMTVWQYAQTQCWAILHYLRLAVIPHPLVLDYGEWTARSAADIVPGAVVVAVLLAGTAIALVWLPWLGFLGVWFFAILAPTSSVVPLPAQTVAEKRMYLPLAAVVTAVIVLSYLGWRWLTTSWAARGGYPRRLASWAPPVVAAAIVCSLVPLTRSRNRAYSNPVTIWRDTVKERPLNQRAQYNLGMALVQADRIPEALECFRTAVTLRPWDAAANGNLAVALVQLDKPEEALPYMRAAVNLKPEDEEAQKALVRLLFQLGHRDEAVASARAYLGRFPELPAANALYASVLVRTGHAPEGVQYLERAHRLAARGSTGVGSQTIP